MSVLIVIPARYASTRYPAKPLALLTGASGTARSLIERSWRAACEVQGVDKVVVATDDDRINLLAADVQGGTGINIDAGAALVQFQVQSGSTAMSIGDGGSDTFTIESNIWDNLAAGSIVLDAIGGDDTITFLEDTLPANLSVDGPDGTLTFAGTGQNFSGASVITTTDVTFLQNFSSFRKGAYPLKFLISYRQGVRVFLKVHLHLL